MIKRLYFQIKSDESARCGEWLTIRAERESEGGEGLSYVWFVLLRHELEGLLEGSRTTAEDGYHKVSVYGDDWLFYDQEFPRDNVGVMQCPFWRLTLPRTFMRAVLRLARKTWRLMRDARESGADRWTRVSEVTLDVTPEHYARVISRFGVGKGSVSLDMNDVTRAFLEAQLAASESDRSLREMLARVECIARNTTRGAHQRARVALSKDGDGFYWRAVAPSGRTAMNGGLVNHGARDGAHDWSIHT